MRHFEKKGWAKSNVKNALKTCTIGVKWQKLVMWIIYLFQFKDKKSQYIMIITYEDNIFQKAQGEDNGCMLTKSLFDF